jgi:hypothetical protein
VASPQTTDTALQMGYVYYDLAAGPLLVIDESCDTLGGAVSPAPVPQAAPLVIDVAIESTALGKQLWTADVALTSSNGATNKHLSAASGGTIGRALYSNQPGANDTRFIGDIAEIVVFTAALPDSDRTAIEAYLRARWGI